MFDNFWKAVIDHISLSFEQFLAHLYRRESETTDQYMVISRENVKYKGKDDEKIYPQYLFTDYNEG